MGRFSIKEITKVLHSYAYNSEGRPRGKDTPYFEEAINTLLGNFIVVTLYDSTESNVVNGVLVIATESDEPIESDGDETVIERRIECFKKMIRNRFRQGREKEPVELKNGYRFIPEIYAVEDLVEFLKCTGLKVMRTHDIECSF